jgi:uncharacterized protein (TIGR02271 family)
MNRDTDKEAREGNANRDPISKKPGAHPVGTGIGAAAGGAATGAAVGSVAGPVGTAAGIVGGAVVGGLAGKGTAEAINPTEEDAYWRQRHSDQWFGRQRGYDDYQGAYRTGYEGFGKYGKGGRSFEECQLELRQDYERNKGRSAIGWEEAQHAARVAWQRVSGNYERIIDYDVHDQAGNKIGSVHNFWVDPSGQPAFLGVKTGWIFGKNHVVPVHTAQVNDRQRIVRLPFSEDKIKNAPSFDADSELSERNIEEIYRYYNLQQPQWPTQAQGTQAALRTAETSGRESGTIKLSEEQLKVGKREVQAGGVRLRKVIRTEIVNRPVELKREEIVIERVPAAGTTAGGAQFQGEDLFIPLRREEAVVEKEARVREEVRISKKATTEQQTVSGEVRREDVEVEQEGQGKPRFGAEKEADRLQTGRYEPKERGKR